MKPFALSLLVALVSVASAQEIDGTSQVLELIASLEAEVHASWVDRLRENRRSRRDAACTIDKVVFRREYGSLSQAERLDYVNAVICLQNKPARTPSSVAPGAKSRFDDFVATHINQTRAIHFTGNFLPWHRWFVYQYEKALRDECGYQGYQPYWDWPKYASSPETSPIFNGDPYSLGGNGEFVPHNGPVIPPSGDLPPVMLPPGNGGGFVTTGPFANMTVNLGPVIPLEGTTPGTLGGLGWNPRGLKRDIGPLLTTRYANYTAILNLLRAPTLGQYRILSEGVPSTIEIGPHGAGHWTIGGDPGADVFTSPGDPAFWVHHGMIDRMWIFWQYLDPRSRFSSVSDGNYGHITWNNDPPSRKTQLDDVLDMGYAAESTTISEVMDTLSSELCYFYL
ncbi:hypothetical protein B0I35DRAFT_437840 [Stachybotrys elegans]|uniref:Tyrosinase copper-binding domain-containing protein n=1 Tax=Stachybotrys elegans TaxID=80388 RepID=A0A8K0WMN7_9HYPO|nr:hypothetical protein B0I35DRAFT_437840 [Stachybotrys elegans]